MQKILPGPEKDPIFRSNRQGRKESPACCPEIKTHWQRLRPLIALLFFTISLCSPHHAMAAQTLSLAGTLTVPDRLSDDSVLVTDLAITELGFSVQGQIRLQTLIPLQGELILDHLSGSPDKIIAILGDLLPPNVTKLADLEVGNLVIKGLQCTFGTDHPTIKITELTYQGGKLADLTATSNQDGLWQLTMSQASLQQLPITVADLPRTVKVQAENLSISLLPDLLMDIKATTLNLEGSLLSNVHFHQEGSAQQPLTKAPFTLAIKGAELDLAQAWNFAGRCPKIQQDLDKKIQALGFSQGLAPRGIVLLNNLAFNGSFSSPPPEEEEKPILSWSATTSLTTGEVGLLVAAGSKNETEVVVTKAAAGISVDVNGLITVQDAALQLLLDGQKLLSVDQGKAHLTDTTKTINIAELEVSLPQLLTLIDKMPPLQTKLNELLSKKEISAPEVTGLLTINELAFSTINDHLSFAGNVVLSDGSLGWQVAADPATPILSGPHHRYTLPKCRAKITHNQETGATTVEDLMLVARDEAKGEITLSGRADWPLNLATLAMDVKVEQLQQDPWLLTTSFGYRANAPIPITISLQGPVNLSTSGRIQPWQSGGNDGMEIICPTLTITIPKSNSAAAPEPTTDKEDAEPLLAKAPPSLPFPIRIQVDQLQLGEYPPLERLLIASATSPPEKDVALSWSGSWCQVELNGGITAAENGTLALDFESQFRDVTLANLIACGLTASGAQSPAIYINGRTYGRLQASSQGNSVTALRKNLHGELSLTIDNGRVMQLSNLHPSLRFMLDILSTLKLNSSKLRNTLPFDRMLIRANTENGGKQLLINTFSLTSPALDLRMGGAGKISMDKEPPTLDLHLKAEMKGFSKTIKKQWLLKSDK